MFSTTQDFILDVSPGLYIDNFEFFLFVLFLFFVVFLFCKAIQLMWELCTGVIRRIRDDIFNRLSQQREELVELIQGVDNRISNMGQHIRYSTDKIALTVDKNTDKVVKTAGNVVRTVKNVIEEASNNATHDVTRLIHASQDLSDSNEKIAGELRDTLTETVNAVAYNADVLMSKADKTIERVEDTVVRSVCATAATVNGVSNALNNHAVAVNNMAMCVSAVIQIYFGAILGFLFYRIVCYVRTLVTRERLESVRSTGFDVLSRISTVVIPYFIVEEGPERAKRKWQNVIAYSSMVFSTLSGISLIYGDITGLKSFIQDKFFKPVDDRVNELAKKQEDEMDDLIRQRFEALNNSELPTREQIKNADRPLFRHVSFNDEDFDRRNYHDLRKDMVGKGVSQLQLPSCCHCSKETLPHRYHYDVYKYKNKFFHYVLDPVDGTGDWMKGGMDMDKGDASDSDTPSVASDFGMGELFLEEVTKPISGDVTTSFIYDLMNKAKNKIAQGLGISAEFSIVELFKFLSQKYFVEALFLAGVAATVVIWMVSKKLQEMTEANATATNAVVELVPDVAPKLEGLKRLIAATDPTNTATFQEPAGKPIIQQTNIPPPMTSKEVPRSGEIEIVFYQDGTVRGKNGESVVINGIVLEGKDSKEWNFHKEAHGDRVKLIIDLTPSAPYKKGNRNWGEDGDLDFKEPDQYLNRRDYVEENDLDDDITDKGDMNPKGGRRYTRSSQTQIKRDQDTSMAKAKGEYIDADNSMLTRYYSLPGTARERLADDFVEKYIPEYYFFSTGMFIDFLKNAHSKHQIYPGFINFAIDQVTPSHKEVDVINANYKQYLYNRVMKDPLRYLSEYFDTEAEAYNFLNSKGSESLLFWVWSKGKPNAKLFNQNLEAFLSKNSDFIMYEPTDFDGSYLSDSEESEEKSPPEVPNMVGNTKTEYTKSTIKELRKNIQDLQKVNKDLRSKYEPKNILANQNRNKGKQMCRNGANCQFFKSGTCNFAHAAPKVQKTNANPKSSPVKNTTGKSSTRQESMISNNLQNNPSLVERGQFRVFVNENAPFYKCSATAMGGRFYFWRHAIDSSTTFKIVNSYFDSGWISVNELYQVNLSKWEVADQLVYLPIKSNWSDRVKSLSVSNAKVQEGTQVWMSCFDNVNINSNNTLVASGKVIAMVPSKDPTYLMYDFSTKDGDCTSGVYIGGSAKLVGLHLIGSASGNMCMYLNKEIWTHMCLPHAKLNLN